MKKGGVGIRAHEKPLKRLKERLKATTSRKRGGTIKRILEELTRQMTGWIGYYQKADIKTHLKHLEEWLRRRIRQLIWKHWKGVRTRHKNLIQLGVDQKQAWQWAYTRKGYWRTAGSQIRATTLTNKYLEGLGFPNLVKRYELLRERTRVREMLLHGTC
jgi:hypothetical protein